MPTSFWRLLAFILAPLIHWLLKTSTAQRYLGRFDISECNEGRPKR